MNTKFSIYSLLILLIFLGTFNTGCSHPSQSYSRYLASKEVSSGALRKAIKENVGEVHEFQVIRNIAQELGIKKVYLFGGTATTYAHKVYKDEEMKINPQKYPGIFPGLDFQNIYRENQDIDLVLDIDEKDSELLHTFLQRIEEEFPYEYEGKSIWDVRPLRFMYGFKLALNSSDFLDQINDSQSTGLIELTENDDYSIRDLKDWDNPNHQYFEDLYHRKIHYYYEPDLHHQTERFLAGTNPEIFSAIRYLNKAFQFGLEIDKESMDNLEKVFNEFNPEEISHNPFIQNNLKHIGPKLYRNSQDLERSYKVLKKLKALEKLQSISDPDEINSISWWMSKVPLLTKPLGNPQQGKTAKELGINIVTHGLNNEENYLSIVNSPHNIPNFFISSTERVGEMGHFGEGLYTYIGDSSGYTKDDLFIRMKVHPDAVEGKDFEVHGNILLIKNKKAIQEIDLDSINFNEELLSQIKRFVDSLIKGDQIFQARTRMIINQNLKKMTYEEASQALEYITLQDFSVSTIQHYNFYFFNIIFNHIIQKLEQDELGEKKLFRFLDKCLTECPNSLKLKLFNTWFESSLPLKYPEAATKILRNSKLNTEEFIKLVSNEKIIQNFLSKDEYLDLKLIFNSFEEYKEGHFLLSEKGFKDTLLQISKTPHILQKYPHLVTFLIEKLINQVNRRQVVELVFQPLVKEGHFDILLKILNHKDFKKLKINLNSSLISALIESDQVEIPSQFLEPLLKRIKDPQELGLTVEDLAKNTTYFDNRLDYLEKLMNRADKKVNPDDYLYSQKDHLLLYEKFHPYGRKWFIELIQMKYSDNSFIINYFSQDFVKADDEENLKLLLLFLQNDHYDDFIKTKVLENKKWIKHPKLIKLSGAKKKVDIKTLLKNLSKKKNSDCQKSIQKLLAS